jgi:hypothetical protein
MAARVVALLGHAAASVRFAAVRLATALMQDEIYHHRHVMLNAGVLPALRLALPSQNVAALIVSEQLQDAAVAEVLPSVLLSLSCLAELGSACIDQILQCDFAQLMAGALRSPIDAVAHAAAVAVGVLLSVGTLAQLRTLLLTHGALDPLCDYVLRARAQRDVMLLLLPLRALRDAFRTAARQQQQDDQGQPANGDDLLAVRRAKAQDVVNVLWAEARDLRVRRVLIAISHDHLGMPAEEAFAAIQNIDAQEQQEQQA